ncbi:hypothetical protein SprV_0602204600 [Sparganum proliferum]
MPRPSLTPSPCAPTATSSITPSAHCTPITLSSTHALLLSACTTTNTAIISAADNDATEFSCTHCPRTFTPRIGLVGHLRIHRTKSGEPVLEAPTYTLRIRLHCPHCASTFMHYMDLSGHMRIHENLR